MDRRSFLLRAGLGAGAAIGVAAGYRHWQEITPAIDYPGRAEGHALRDYGERRALPAPSAVIDTDVLVAGSGIAGLTAAWKLKRDGHADFIVLDGPQAYGNAAGRQAGELAWPTGAHYLPLPSIESSHVREMLSDLGVILRNPLAEKPYYDERFVLHAPQERVLVDGAWQEGVIPREGVPAWELREQDRFFGEMERLKAARGSDGRRLFVVPLALSSDDAHTAALDRVTMRQWLDAQGYRAPTLHWYLDYCCRDDYGRGYGEVSAWAGLHYFCGRNGDAENAERGAWLTWPGGLQPLAAGLDRLAGSRRRGGTVASMAVVPGGVRALCFELVGGVPKTFIVHARRAICAMPLFVAARVVDGIAAYGFDAARDLPAYAPWMVSNFLMRRFPQEQPHLPLSWENIVYRGRGLGYVNSTHQDIRAAPPARTVFSAYHALSDMTPSAARKWLERATPDALLELASSDLKAAYGRQFAGCVERVDITLRAHAMAVPRVGFRSNRGAAALRAADGPILFAHGDLSGLSLFEEASWWGYQAARRAAD